MSQNEEGRHVVLTDPATGKSVKLPVHKAKLGQDVIDIRTLHKETGYFTYDPGFLATASCDSRITFIDGNKGILLHRGYPIEELVDKCTYLEVVYLLLRGDLPNEEEFSKFDHIITRHSMLHEQIPLFFRGFRRDAHPMSIMVGVVGALSSFYHDSLDISDPHQRMVASHRMIAKMPTIAAHTYKYALGQPFRYPDNNLDYASNFLQMCFSVPAEPYKVPGAMARAMDKLLILHADHEQNASTSTVRLAGSSGANPFACVASGIASLWGPAHGGANQEVLEMLEEIGSTHRIPEFIAKAKDKSDRFKLMGFGHRVYRNHDPRAQVLKKYCDELLDELGVSDPMLDLARELEKIALEDEYFVTRQLFPNVDFYSGIILRAMGFPTSMFTVLFALARVTGWVSQWNEMIEDPGQKIGRPRQLYLGETQRSVKARSAR